MKIVIDATTLLLPSAGVKNYLYYWLSSLRDAATGYGHTIKTYPPAITPEQLDHEQSGTSALGTFLRLGMAHFCNVRGNPALDLFHTGADVFHASQHLAHRPRWKKVTATVFDLSCWTHAESHTPANIAATQRYAEKILKQCDGLIAISRHTLRDTVEILGIPEARIRVIYPGVAEQFFTVTPEQTTEIRARYQLRAPYLLFVGCIEPRKNVPSLIQAYHQLAKRLRREIQLVIAGPFGWASAEVRKMLGDPGVRYLGYVPEADLPGLFGGALALAYPSFYEGFGFPVAQAMAAGIPVITSDRAALPEVVGEAGICVDPDSVDELSGALERVVTHPDIARELGRQGRRTAQKFRWSACAAASFEFFREIAGSN